MHYICSNCLTFPKISFLNQNKINIKCNCENKNRELSIKDINEFITHKDLNSITNNNIICNEHNQKFAYFCQNCEKNLCQFCQKNCFLNNHKIFNIIDIKLLNQIIPIKKKIMERQKIKYEKKNETEFNFEDNNTIILVRENDYLIKKQKKEEKEISIDLESLLDSDIDIEEEYLYFFFIIINDYINYPNIIHNYNVKNIIKFMIDFYCPNKFVMKYNYNSSGEDSPN